MVGQPSKKVINYVDKKGEEHKVLFDCIQIKNFERLKFFLQPRMLVYKQLLMAFEYDANWLSPKIGGWFIYISSDSLPSDMYRNIDLDGLDENVRHYKDLLESVK